MADARGGTKRAQRVDMSGRHLRTYRCHRPTQSHLQPFSFCSISLAFFGAHTGWWLLHRVANGQCCRKHVRLPWLVNVDLFSLVSKGLVLLWHIIEAMKEQCQKGHIKYCVWFPSQWLHSWLLLIPLNIHEHHEWCFEDCSYDLLLLYASNP